LSDSEHRGRGNGSAEEAGIDESERFTKDDPGQ
jgi:hypothetical protein